MGARRAGFSLIELLTVVAIMGMVAVYMGRILTVNEKTYSSTDQLSQAQQNLRAISSPRPSRTCGPSTTCWSATCAMQG
jgi:prepilin-type N-terminal cleavage/methylation domain-containing protein